MKTQRCLKSVWLRTDFVCPPESLGEKEPDSCSLRVLPMASVCARGCRKGIERIRAYDGAVGRVHVLVEECVRSRQALEYPTTPVGPIRCGGQSTISKDVPRRFGCTPGPFTLLDAGLRNSVTEEDSPRVGSNDRGRARVKSCINQFQGL